MGAPHVQTTYARSLKINSFLTKMQRHRDIKVNPWGPVKIHATDAAREKIPVPSQRDLLGDRSGGNDDEFVRRAAAVRGVQQLAYPHRRHRPAEQVALRLGH